MGAHSFIQPLFCWPEIIMHDKLDIDKIEGLSEKELEDFVSKYQFSFPWQYDADEAGYRDPDIPLSATKKDDENLTRAQLQALSWIKFLRNPQINTSIRGVIGRLTGYGFEVSSDIQEIQETIEEIEEDPRNRLYNFWPKYVGRSFIEGELFVCFTCHKDGFIEVDFIDPAALESGEVESGIIFHPNKTTMPLIYCIKKDDESDVEQIPSIFLARYPELIKIAREQKGFDENALKNSKSRKRAFDPIGGFYRFVVSWDKSFITQRNISHVRTVLEWLNMYENLKRYEMDHKKSAGAYIWNVQFDDIKSWMQWMKLSDADKAKTGIAAKKTPGGTMITGPNMTIKAVNPNLPNISNTDTDILQMVTSGLNEPEDITTGKATSPFASVKASRGPMSDRTSDEIAYFEKFLRFDFWANIFFLKSKINNKFPEYFEIEKAVTFKDKKPVFKKLKKKPEKIIEINFPLSEVTEFESRAKAYYGSKHAALSDMAGMPNEELVKKMGFGNFRKLRLQYETEKKHYPDLPLQVDLESIQEKKQAEPARKGNAAGSDTDSK